MARSPSNQPTQRELELLKVLWRLGPSRLSEVCAQLRQSESIATTTVATILKLMENKGLAKRQTRDGQILWMATATHQATRNRFLKNLVESLFDGSAKLLVSHLHKDGKLSAQETEELSKMLAQSTKKKD